jgi:2'-5' RNA ligase
MNPPVERLFLALWPAAALQQRLAALVDAAHSPRGGGRRALSANLHMTLAFLGAVDAPTRAQLEARIDARRRERFELVLDRMGCFRRRGLLWVGASAPAPALLGLVADLKAAQLACGLAPDARDYRAHVTLARNLRRCPPPMPIDPIVWPVHEFVLVRSDLGGTGARYEVVRRWALG